MADALTIDVDPTTFTDDEWADITKALGVSPSDLDDVDRDLFPDLVGELMVCCLWIAGRRSIPEFTLDAAREVTLADIDLGG